jgi:hypothetical protein
MNDFFGIFRSAKSSGREEKQRFPRPTTEAGFLRFESGVPGIYKERRKPVIMFSRNRRFLRVADKNK